MDAFAFVLGVLILATVWALLAPVGRPTSIPTADELAERQRQIDRANHSELL